MKRFLFWSAISITALSIGVLLGVGIISLIGTVSGDSPILSLWSDLAILQGRSGSNGVSPGVSPEKLDYTFDVEWSEDTTLVDEHQLNTLRQADMVNYVFRFDAQAVAASGLDISRGRVLVIHGLALRRITDVREEQGELIVTTSHANLNEAIYNGVIEWDYQVRFDESALEVAFFNDQELIVLSEGQDDPAYQLMIHHGDATPLGVQLLDQNSREATFKIEKDGYEFILKLVFRGDFLEVEIKGAKTMGVAGAASAHVSATGRVEGFNSNCRMVFWQGELVEYRNVMDKLSGEFDLELAVTSSGRDMLDIRETMPGISIRFLVGSMPVKLTLAYQVIIEFVVPYDGSAFIQARVKYNNDLGFYYDGTEVELKGSLDYLDMGSDQHHTAGSGPTGVNFGLGFPRFSLGLFENIVVPWAQTGMLIGGSFTTTPPCQTADVLFLAAAGIDLNFLGMKYKLAGGEFFREYRPLLRAGDCPPEEEIHPWLKRQ